VLADVLARLAMMLFGIVTIWQFFLANGRLNEVRRF
jgi:hypothetical protein